VYLLIGLAMAVTAALAAALVSSVCLTLAWLLLKVAGRRMTPKGEARFWFAVGVTPALAGFAVATLIAAPSYFIHEQRGTGELISPLLSCVLAIGLLLMLAAITSASMTLVRGRRLTAALRGYAGKREVAGCEAYELPGSSGTFAVVGVLRPTMFVSSAVLRELNETELRGVVRHEQAHVASRHNAFSLLLKMAGHLSANPIFAWLARRQWVEAIELEADHAAIVASCDALDLCSALIKITRLDPCEPRTAGAGCSFAPFRSGSRLERRIERLRCAADGKPILADAGVRWLRPAVAFVMLVLGAALVWSGPALLLRTHEALEALMR
jgi:Zn-dependent protease with chaperone function